MENSIPEICMRIIQWQFDSSSIQTFTIGNAMKANHENDNDKSIETLCWSNINSFIFQVPLILNATARFDDIRTISALEFDVYFMTSFLLSFFLSLTYFNCKVNALKRHFWMYPSQRPRASGLPNLHLFTAETNQMCRWARVCASRFMPVCVTIVTYTAWW